MHHLPKKRLPTTDSKAIPQAIYGKSSFSFCSVEVPHSLNSLRLFRRGMLVSHLLFTTCCDGE